MDSDSTGNVSPGPDGMATLNSPDSLTPQHVSPGPDGMATLSSPDTLTPQLASLQITCAPSPSANPSQAHIITSAAKPLVAFHKFPKLPVEIQMLIWKLHIWNGPRFGVRQMVKGVLQEVREEQYPCPIFSHYTSIDSRWVLQGVLNQVSPTNLFTGSNHVPRSKRNLVFADVSAVRRFISRYTDVGSARSMDVGAVAVICMPTDPIECVLLLAPILATLDELCIIQRIGYRGSVLLARCIRRSLLRLSRDRELAKGGFARVRWKRPVVEVIDQNERLPTSEGHWYRVASV